MYVLSPILITIGVMSFIFLKLWRKTLLIFLFPLFQILFYASFLSNDIMSNLQGTEDRLLIASTLFFIILVAVFIDQLTLGRRFRLPRIFLRVSKLRFSINLSSILIFIVIFTLFSAQFYPIYSEVVTRLETRDIKASSHLDGAINWINENTGSNDVIASREPYIFSWYTNRHCVIFEQDINADEMLTVIRNYQVKYIIDDQTFDDSYPNLKNLYMNPNNPVSGFQLVFESSNSDGTKVLIYNTTQLTYTNFRLTSYAVDIFNNLTGWTVMYGNLSLDTIDWKEGNSSLRLESQASSAEGQFIGKISRIISTENFSKAVYLSLILKSNLTLGNNMRIQLFDANSNWVVYSIPYTEVDQWQNVTISIGSSISHSFTVPDMAKIQTIILWVIETPMPFIVRFDQLSIITFTEIQSQNTG